MASVMRFSACPVLLASVPPPWAMSGLPPPPPPSSAAAALTRSPAKTPCSRANAFVPMTTTGRPLALPVTATTAGRSSPSRPRTSVTNRRASSAPTPSPASCPTKVTPPTSCARCVSEPAAANTDCWRAVAISRSACFRRTRMDSTRAASSSGRAFNASLSWPTIACSRAKN